MSATPTDPVDNATLEDRLYTVKYEDPGESHLDVKQTAICKNNCEVDECEDVCPANVWRRGEDGIPTIAYENCLECGSCRYACSKDNVVWTYPERGSGVTYKKG